MTVMDFVWAFVIGGLICVIGQLLMDVANLTPAHTMCTFVVTGSVLGALGWYQPLVEFAGAGASVPILSFGNSLVKGALGEFATNGWLGLITGIFELTGAGISTAIIFSFIAALFCKPKA